MMLEISIDWPGKFTQGKPRSHWTRRAGARDRAPHTRGTETQALASKAPEAPVCSTKPTTGTAADQWVLY